MKGSHSMPAKTATRTRIDPSRVLARDVMQTDVLVFRPDDSIQSAAEQLEEIGASGAPVVDDAGRLIGVLTTSDIARSEHVDGGRISTRFAGASEPDAASTSDAAGFDEEVLPTPAFGDRVCTDYMIGMAKVKGTVKILLDLDRVLGTDDATFRAA